MPFPLKTATAKGVRETCGTDEAEQGQNSRKSVAVDGGDLQRVLGTG